MSAVVGCCGANRCEPVTSLLPFDCGWLDFRKILYKSHDRQRERSGHGSFCAVIKEVTCYIPAEERTYAQTVCCVRLFVHIDQMYMHYLLKNTPFFMIPCENKHEGYL